MYTPLWLTTSFVDMIGQPTLLMIQSFEWVKRTLSWLRRHCRLPEPTHQEMLDKEVLQTQKLISTVLANLGVGLAFGTWTPLLTVFSFVLAPLTVIALTLRNDYEQRLVEQHKANQECSKHDRYNAFCRSLVAHIKVTFLGIAACSMSPYVCCRLQSQRNISAWFFAIMFGFHF